MKWDWMILPGASLLVQLLFDLVAPLLIVLLFRINRFNSGRLLENDSSFPLWVRSLWKYLLALSYVWFFSATVWHFGSTSIRQLFPSVFH